MKKQATFGFVVALSAATLAVGPMRAGTLAGAPGDAGAGDCAPFGCPNDATYQQIYDSSLFPTPLSITGITFFIRNFDHAGFGITPVIYPANYTIQLSIVPIAVDALDTTLSNNLNPDPGKTQLFFDGPLGDGITPIFDHFTILQNQGDFLYDPAQGNLLMQVTNDGVSLAFDMFMDVDRDFNKFGIAFDSDPHPAVADCNVGGAAGSFSGGDTAGCVQTRYGLVTEFNTASDFGEVPEPGTGALLGLGLTAVFAAVGRRHRRPGL